MTHKQIIHSMFNEFHDGIITEQQLINNIVDYVYDICDSEAVDEYPDHHDAMEN